MRAKPKGRKYRNLFARSGVIYYERIVGGRRIKLSTKTSDWEVAASFRDLYEDRKRIGIRVPIQRAPTFGEFADRYLREATGHLAASTKEDRDGLLKADGKLTAYFGQLELDEIGRANLVEWWTAEIEAEGLSPKTGKNRLDALSAVLGYAIDLELIETNPVDAFRATLRRRNRTKKGRAESVGGAKVRPIEAPEEMLAFYEASRSAEEKPTWSICFS